jgi:hypothetical protein
LPPFQRPTQQLSKPQLKLLPSKAHNQPARARTNRSTPAIKEPQLQDRASRVQPEVLVEQAVALLHDPIIRQTEWRLENNGMRWAVYPVHS